MGYPWQLLYFYSRNIETTYLGKVAGIYSDKYIIQVHHYPQSVSFDIMPQG